MGVGLGGFIPGGRSKYRKCSRYVLISPLPIESTA